MTLNQIFPRQILPRLGLAVVLAAGMGASVPAHALTAKECRAAFNKAKTDGTLNGQKYKAFKAAQCGNDKDTAKPAPAAATAPAATTSPSSASGTPATGAPKTEPAATTPTSTPSATKSPSATPTKTPVVSSGNVVFPNAIDPQYAKLSPGRARQKTCVAQYNTNKASGGNGNLKWIQRGGGYWSQCNAHLKGGN